MSGEYKYIETIHNCVALLTDVYTQSDLPNHFSLYFTDEELLDFDENPSETTIPAFVHRFYYTGNQIDPDRAAIKEFMLATFGNNYAKNWYMGVGISQMEVDLEKAQDFPKIIERIEEAKAIRQLVYPELINITSTVHNQTATSSDVKALSNYLINRAITYQDLYYTYVLNHELEIAKLFSNTPAAPAIIKTADDFLYDYCSEFEYSLNNDLSGLQDDLSHHCWCAADLHY